MEIAALYHQGRITLRRDLGTSGPATVLVATSMILRWWVERPSWEERGDGGMRDFHCCPLWDQRSDETRSCRVFLFFFVLNVFVFKLWKVESAVFHVVEAARQDLPEVGVFYNGNFRGQWVIFRLRDCQALLALARLCSGEEHDFLPQAEPTDLCTILMFSASNGQNTLHACVSVQQEFSYYHFLMNHMKVWFEM